MPKFNEEQLKLIKKAHDEVQELENKQDLIYNNLLSSLNIKKGSNIEDYLFEYIYNDGGNLDKINIIVSYDRTDK